MKICPECNKECVDTAKFCGGCRHRFAVPVCSSCGKSVREGAKFCGHCGMSLRSIAANTMGKEENSVDFSVRKDEFAVPGTNVLASQESPIQVDVSAADYLNRLGGFLRWNILPGQLAVKIDEEDLYKYGRKVKGIDIQTGVKALLFIYGKFAGELDSGHYPFADWQDELAVEETPGAIQRHLRRLWTAFIRLWNKEKAEEMRRDSARAPFCFVLIRTNEFPLIYEFADIATSTVSCNIGIHLLFKITNLDDFYANHLLKQKYVSFESLSRYRELIQAIKTQLSYLFAQISPEQIATNADIEQQLMLKLRPVISGIFPYIQLSRILNVSAKNEDLNNFRRMAEELYISERELEIFSQRNDFLNRLELANNEQEELRLKRRYAHCNEVTDINYAQEELVARRDSMHKEAMQSIENARELTELRMSVDQDIESSKIEAEFTAVKEKIYEEMALTEDKRTAFDLMLSAQKKLREADSEEKIAAAMQEFRKSGLLREQEIDVLQHQIAHNAQMRDLNDAHVLSMVTMQNQKALDQQKLEWEIQIGNKRIQNHFDRQRIADAYREEKRDKEYNFTDQRREKDAAFEDKRRLSQIDLDKLEMQQQLEILAQAQAIRQQRENEELRREMEKEEAARRHELEIQRLTLTAEQAKIEAANEEKRIYAGMTFEQIMAANPNFSPHAAQALAKKYEADAAAATAQTVMTQNDKTAQMAIDQRDQMVTFMQQQMAMLRDISVTGINAGAGHRQAMLEEKQAELDRTRADVSANCDRFVDGMKTTIHAVGNMNRPTRSQTKSVLASHDSETTDLAAMKQEVKCSKCNSKNVAGEAFCCECGEAL